MSLSDKNLMTWANYHPEVAEIFSKKYIDWPCEKIDTSLSPVVQPSIAKGPDQKLFVIGHKGHLFHSTDVGKSWSLLCKAPPLSPKVPDGFKLIHSDVGGGVTEGAISSGGIGVTRERTILLIWSMSYNKGRSGDISEDEFYHNVTWMTRSEDGGKSWEATSLFDPSPYQVISNDQGHVLQLSNGCLVIPLLVKPWTRPGKPISITEKIFMSAFIYMSSDAGKTWSKFSKFTDRSAESHLLELPSGRILGALRYQRDKLPDDPGNLRTGYSRELWHDFAHGKKPWSNPTDIGVRIFQNTSLTDSEDGGKNWSTPRVITGLLQQSGCIIRLSDGTLVLTFGRPGQRFMLSYDDGTKWSKAVYELHNNGEYARSVVLEDDTIVTIHDHGHFMHYKNGDQRLGVLRWRIPPQEEVEKYGFFTPREVEKGLR